MLRIIKKLLLNIVDDIDAGNSELSEEEEIKVIKTLQRYSRKDNQWSKYQAYTFLNISRATFDRYVKGGIIPRGKSRQGHKELYWSEKEIRKIARERFQK